MLLLLLLFRSKDGTNRIDPGTAYSSSLVKSKLKLMPKRIRALNVIDNRTNLIEAGKVKVKAEVDSSRRYIGRVIDKHGFGLSSCTVYLSDDWDRFEAPKPDLYDLLRKKPKTHKTVITSMYALKTGLKKARQCFKAVTDIEGRYFFDVTDVFNDVPLLIIEGPEGFQDISRQLTLPKNKDIGDTVLQQTGKIFGSVTKIGNEMVEKAGVVLIPADEFENYIRTSNIDIAIYPYRVTSSDGAFEFNDIPAGRYYLTCKAKVTRESSVPVTVREGSIIRQDLVLRPGQRIELTVQDREGNAIPDAKIAVRSTDPWYIFNEVENDDRQSRDDSSGVTDEHGRASLGPVYEDHARLTITASGFGESRRWVESNKGVDRVELQIVLSPPTVITGRVVNADKQVPKARAILESFHHNGERSYEILFQQDVDAEGQFQLPTMGPGKYFLRVARIEPDFHEKPLEEYQRSITISQHKAVIDLGTIQLKRRCTVRWTVLDAHNSAVPKVSVSAIQEQEKLRSEGVTDKHGAVSLPGLIPGPAIIFIRNNQGTIAVQNLVIPDSDQSDQRIHLPAQLGQLRISMFDHLGRPVTSGCFVLWIPGTAWQSLQVSEDLLQENGHCTLSNLPPGPVDISFYSEYPRRIHRLEMGQIEIQSGEMTELRLQLPVPK
ncbi:MAG: carboxypeptidase-like regulatory domain-containing protein [Planctomycetota bacterium]|nr:carboxypeptidase-like regulatory domain-containing protein [Planctomycetota bacterium]